MCVPILKSIGSELTSCDAKTLRHAELLIDSLTSGSEVMAQIVVFVFSVTLTLTFDLCSFFMSHALRMMYWNIYAKFH